MPNNLNIVLEEQNRALSMTAMLQSPTEVITHHPIKSNDV